MSICVICILVLLAMRHLPQFAIDLSNLRRDRLVTWHTRARGEYVILLYLVICIASLFSMQRGIHTFGLLSAFGWAVFVLGLALGSIGILTLGRSYSIDISLRADFQLVTSGIYGLVRHPIRLGLVLEPLGLLIMSGVWILVLPWLGIVVMLIIRSWEEDAFLRQELGVLARDYQSRVPAFNLPLGVWLKVGRAVTARVGTESPANSSDCAPIESVVGTSR